MLVIRWAVGVAAAATVLGAVGGGFAGNAIEGNMKKVTVYRSVCAWKTFTRDVGISKPRIGWRA
jgi:uncharacterized protein YcfJ